MDEQLEEELGYEAHGQAHEAQREQVMSELQEGNKTLKDENKRLKKAISKVPTDEYYCAQREGCDASGAWECFLKELHAWAKQALKVNS